MTGRAVTLDDGTKAVACGRLLYLPDDGPEEMYPGAYKVRGQAGVAWRVFGREIETFDNGEGFPDWRETERLVCVMVGDDHREAFEPDDVTPLDEDAYCHECGQVGCTHDGRERGQS